jgi:hypothetical protein
MKQKFGMHALAVLAMLCVGIVASATEAAAQGKAKIDKAKLIGTWTLVSITNTGPDGKAQQTFGQGDGVLIFGANGKFIQILARGDLPKFASNNRNTGTADENKAVVIGSLAIFGTYTINAKDGTLVLHIDRSSYPNWDNGDQTRVIASLTASELKWNIPAPSIGGNSNATWKRSK